MSDVHDDTNHVGRLMARRAFIKRAAAGTAVAALGGWYLLSEDELTARARNQTRPDGRPRLPAGQRVIERLKPMGGQPGDPSPRSYRLAVHGLVERPLSLDFAALQALPTVTQRADVHCVTGWSMLGGRWTGVRVAELARRAGVQPEARHVIFEAAHRYTANVRLDEALTDDALVAWTLDDQPLGRAHGAPVRSLVPDLYFWKSAKWLTGIRFVARDTPGYWERRGYHNHADPWKEERYG